ncbi:Topless-related protein 4 [Cardamine amara subsp. amara]|uniref:Topless-related protein 4 n=1 Tax=Cardamine amara subsp. amara TaxID=228776 RepID=A0ABD1BIJ9_CARAN
MILDETNRKNLIFLILQFLSEEGYEKSLHLLEQDSGIFFNFSYFSNVILDGNWKEAEDYLSAFTTPDVNTFSRNMFLDLFKWKASEASDRSGSSESVNIFYKDLRRIPVLKDDSFNDLVEVIAVDDMRVPDQTYCVDKASVRAKLCVDLLELADNNPSLLGKRVFPKLYKSALMSLISLICPNCSGAKGGLKEDLICLILQFLHEAKYKNTLHKLEQEAKVFFNLNYLGEVMKLGKLDKAEEYLAAFTISDNNKYSKAMFLEIQKLKCLESTKWEVTAPPGSPDNMSPKRKLHASVGMLAKKNPVLRDKLEFPSMEKSRLSTLIKQTMDWWTPRTCNTPNSLENVPVVPYLCRTPSSLKNKFNKTGPRKKADNFRGKEINDPSECNALVLPDYCSEERIVRLTYSPSGDYILALAEDTTHKLWTWSSGQNEFCKHTPRMLKENVFPQPRLHEPQSGKTMKNEVATSVQNSTSCFAIKGSYLFSTSGGKIAVFDVKSFEKLAAFGSHTPTATHFIFIPGDLLAVGLDDGSIFIHCLSSRKVIEKLEGHDQRITCLAFSRCFNVLISSGANGELCVWNSKSWVKVKRNKSSDKICTRHNHESSSVVTHIQFDPYEIELLVVHEGWIGVYEARTLDLLMQWVPDASNGLITSATYSSDGENIYVGFRSGSIKILDSKPLVTICRINLTAFTQPGPSNMRLEVYPTVVAAHPSHPSQISAGLSNGKVIVLQPLWSGGWGEDAPPEDDGDYSDSSDNNN